MSRLKVTSSNNLLKLYPNLVKNEWDFSKNKLSPIEVVAGTGKKAWWICPEKNHSYEAIIANRTYNNSGCPYCTGVKVGRDNNLKYVNKKAADEWDFDKNNKKPEEVLATSSKKYWFKCSVKNHSFFTSPESRTRGGTGCPYCAGVKVGKDNNLKALFPKIAKQWDYEKNNLSPEDVVPGSRRKAYFKCKNGHSYEISIYIKVKLNSCKFCTGTSASEYKNLTHTKFFKEWDYKKNKIDPKTVTQSTAKEYWWLCSKKHSWKQAVNIRANNRGCPFCANRRVSSDNNLKTLFPKIAKEWDFKKNDKNPEDVVFGSHYLAYWKCNKNHSYSARVYRRTTRDSGCPYCSGLLPSKENNLKLLFPKIAQEWDYQKNKEKPTEITSQSDKKRWWICSVGHSYYMSPNERTPSIKGKTAERKCPYCTLTPRSRDEIYILFELKKFFQISENDHKIKLSRINDVDIKLPNEKIVIEYDGAYWHKDKAERDKRKTKELQKAGWTVIRVREKPLKILSRKYNVLAISQEYKNNTNKVLKKISGLGYQVNGLNKYLARKSLINKDAADKYMIKLVKEKASVS